MPLSVSQLFSHSLSFHLSIILELHTPLSTFYSLSLLFFIFFPPCPSTSLSFFSILCYLRADRLTRLTLEMAAHSLSSEQTQLVRTSMHVQLMIYVHLETIKFNGYPL